MGCNDVMIGSTSRWTRSETCPVADVGFKSTDASGYAIENGIVS